MRQSILKLIDKNQTNNLKHRLIKGIAGSFGLTIASTGLSFLTSILLARLLGTKGLGIYSYIFAWIGILSIPATLGLDKLFVREIAIYQTKSQWGLINGLLRWANLVVLAFSISLAVVAVIVFSKVSTVSSSVLAFLIASIYLPLIALENLRQGAMRGLHKVVLGNIPEALIYPLLFITLIVGGYIWFGQNFINVSVVLGIKVVVSLVIFILGTIWLNRLLPQQSKDIKPEYQIGKWIRSALPLMFLGSMQLINAKTDVLMLGAITGSEAVGIYVVVRQGAQMILFLQGAANSVLAPNIASLYAQGKIKQLQKIISQSSAVVFVISLSIALALIILSSWLLQIYGSSFVAGRNSLIILSIGEIVNTLMGPVGILLTMTGHEKYTVMTVSSSAILNVILNALLIPQWGVNGAAIATATSIIIINIVNMLVARKKLKILSAAWGIFSVK